jgi:hypothetical protein
LSVPTVSVPELWRSRVALSHGAAAGVLAAVAVGVLLLELSSLLPQAAIARARAASEPIRSVRMGRI